jgi:hypothetical protein
MAPFIAHRTTEFYCSYSRSFLIDFLQKNGQFHWLPQAKSGENLRPCTRLPCSNLYCFRGGNSILLPGSTKNHSPLPLRSFRLNVVITSFAVFWLSWPSMRARTSAESSSLLKVSLLCTLSARAATSTFRPATLPLKLPLAAPAPLMSPK